MKTKTKLVLLLLITFGLYNCQNQKKKVEIDYSVFEVNNGWGYDITINKKTFIHQDVIPTVKNARPFFSQDDAEKVAKLVIEKIKKKQMPPAVSKDEIEKLGIKTDS